MRLTVIHNPKAGDGARGAGDIEARLRAPGFEATVVSRRDAGLDAALAAPAEAVAIAGGDGTIDKMLPRLLERGLPVGLLPFGTANNIARSLGVSGPLEEIARRWRSGARRPLDVGAAAGPWGRRLFIEGCGVGALAAGLAEVKGLGAKGEARLALARETLARRVAEAAPRDYAVSAEEEALPPDLLLAEATQIARLGPGLVIAPDADPGDGRLDLAYARAADRAALVEWLRAEGEAGPAPLCVLRARRVRFGRPEGAIRLGDRLTAAEGRAPVEIEAAAAALTLLG